MKFTELAHTVIRLADERGAYRQACRANLIGKSVPDNPNWTHGRDLLLEFLWKLPPVAIYWLFAVSYIGRGTDDPADPWGVVEDLRGWFPQAWKLPELMAIQDNPSDQLRDGLAAIAKAGIDLDADLGEWPALPSMQAWG